MATVIMTIPFEQLGVVDADVPGRPVGHQTYRNVTQLQATSLGRYDNHTVGFLNNNRPAPSVPQFSGTVAPIREVLVSLRRADRGILETVTTDGAGYFVFNGWYAVYSDYEFVIHGDDLYQMKVYPVSAPIAHRWNGAPDRYDSTSFV
jgi:hypothetical protein